jgi:glycosyltransferase involved in cell wall biosynthesis
MLRNYHAVVIPSITDEQPRIVFDCYSQAIPVIASDTHGLRSCVANGVTGRLVQPGDTEALAGVIASVRTDIAGLERMGLAALEVARKHTHRRMHEERQVLLLARFDARAALSHQG